MQVKKPYKRNQVLNAIKRGMMENGRCPSLVEVELMTGLKHATVQRYMKDLCDEGYLIHTGTKYITKYEEHPYKMAAVLGSVPCGPLTEENECITDYMILSESITGPDDCYILTAYGDSMIEAGIEEGDLVLIRKTTHATYGDIIVALVDNAVTLKTYAYNRELGVPYLHPENASMKDIYVDQLDIQGVAIRVIKTLQRHHLS